MFWNMWEFLETMLCDILRRKVCWGYARERDNQAFSADPRFLLQLVEQCAIHIQVPVAMPSIESP